MDRRVHLRLVWARGRHRKLGTVDLPFVNPGLSNPHHLECIYRSAGDQKLLWHESFDAVCVSRKKNKEPLFADTPASQNPSCARRKGLKQATAALVLLMSDLEDFLHFERDVVSVFSGTPHAAGIYLGYDTSSDSSNEVSIVLMLFDFPGTTFELIRRFTPDSEIFRH